MQTNLTIILLSLRPIERERRSKKMQLTEKQYFDLGLAQRNMRKKTDNFQ